MTHRHVLEAMSGLLLGMFVAILSSTVVTTALPEIIGDLGGSQSFYTWVVTSTLLALTVTTPIWGKLADLFDRKLLVQTGLAIYVIGSILAGLSQSTSWLIGCRVLQIARAMSPTESGLLSIPMVLGLSVSSLIIGRRVTRTGRYKH